MILQIQLAGQLTTEGEWKIFNFNRLCFIWGPSWIEVDRDPTTEDDLAGLNSPKNNSRGWTRNPDEIQLIEGWNSLFDECSKGQWFGLLYLVIQLNLEPD